MKPRELNNVLWTELGAVGFFVVGWQTGMSAPAFQECRIGVCCSRDDFFPIRSGSKKTRFVGTNDLPLSGELGL
jgi:hypothetical protein